MANTVKCRYAHCRHPDDVRPPDQMVKDPSAKGTMYYHAECLEEKNKIAEIRYYYKTNIDFHVGMAFLNKMINEAVIERRIPPDDLLFALKFYKKTGRTINNPSALLFITKSKAVQKEKQRITAEKSFDFGGKNEELGKQSTEFKYKPVGEKKGFGSILKKG